MSADKDSIKLMLIISHRHKSV